MVLGFCLLLKQSGNLKARTWRASTWVCKFSQEHSTDRQTRSSSNLANYCTLLKTPLEAAKFFSICLKLQQTRPADLKITIWNNLLRYCLNAKHLVGWDINLGFSPQHKRKDNTASAQNWDGEKSKVRLLGMVLSLGFLLSLFQAGTGVQITFICLLSTWLC